MRATTREKGDQYGQDYGLSLNRFLKGVIPKAGELDHYAIEDIPQLCWNAPPRLLVDLAEAFMRWVVAWIVYCVDDCAFDGSALGSPIFDSLALDPFISAVTASLESWISPSSTILSLPEPVP